MRHAGMISVMLKGQSQQICHPLSGWFSSTSTNLQKIKLPASQTRENKLETCKKSTDTQEALRM